MKIYTKTGDGGETGLFGGRRVGKDHLRVAAYGDVDELNATLGLAVANLGESLLVADLRRIQAELFVLGADLATPPGAKADVQAKTLRIGDDRVPALEAAIDRLDAELPPLRHFVLPGGSPGAAALHLARAICRRAERAVVALSRVEAVNPVAIVYLNRLSDLLFVMARWENQRLRVEEPLWRGHGGDSAGTA